MGFRFGEQWFNGIRASASDLIASLGGIRPPAQTDVQLDGQHAYIVAIGPDLRGMFLEPGQPTRADFTSFTPPAGRSPVWTITAGKFECIVDVLQILTLAIHEAALYVEPVVNRDGSVNADPIEANRTVMVPAARRMIYGDTTFEVAQGDSLVATYPGPAYANNQVYGPPQVGTVPMFAAPRPYDDYAKWVPRIPIGHRLVVKYMNVASNAGIAYRIREVAGGVSK